jgi:hypothetical protein
MSLARELRKKHESSSIFAAPDVRPVTEGAKVRNSRTFLDSNIFGAKAQEADVNISIDQKSSNSPNKKFSENPNFRKSTVIEHFFNEDAEKVKEDRKNKKKGTGPLSKKEVDEFKRLSQKPSRDSSAKKQRGMESNVFEQSPKHKAPEDSYNMNEIYACNVKWNDSISQRKFQNKNSLDQSHYSQYASVRKTADMSSDIFNVKKAPINKNIFDVQDVQDRPKTASHKTKDFVDRHNEEHRRKDQRYSDIFGSDVFLSHNEKFSSSPKKKSMKVPTNTDWRDSKTALLTQSPSKEGLSPGQRKQQEDLRGSVGGSEQPLSPRGNISQNPKKFETPREEKKEGKLENKIISPRSSKVPESVQNSVNAEVPKPEVARPKPNVPGETLEYDLKGIPKHFTETELKKIFEGFSIVDFKAEVNKNTGKILGSATVKIKKELNSKIIELKERLKSQGILMFVHFERVKRKNQ